MVGIESISTYLPAYRLDRKEVFKAYGWVGSNYLPGERTVANHDEDSITMAVAAAMKCPKDVDALFFASTTMPYKGRQNASIIATALDLGPDVTTADFGGSTKAVTTALISAYNYARSGKKVLVCASDCRIGKAGGLQEVAFGDGAAAAVVGDDKIASIDDSFSLSYDFMDSWRIDEARYDKAWEDRWVRDEGYKKFIVEAISKLIEVNGLKTENIAKVCYPCLYLRDHPKIGLSLGFTEDQIQEHLFTAFGDTGNAYPLILLAASLESAAESDRLIMASYGSGSDALLLTAKGKYSQEKLKKRSMPYEKYAVYRNLIPIELGQRGEETSPTAVSLLWRDRREIMALVGSKCKECSTLQYPAQRVCVACGSQDMVPYSFADKTGKIFSYTEDHLAASMSPPAIYGIIDFDGGGRFWFDIADSEAGELRVGMAVKMAFRRKYADMKRGIYGYFWKAVPEVA
jgi:3-hydroxy-3-methylglutaryl CoA synthase